MIRSLRLRVATLAVAVIIPLAAAADRQQPRDPGGASGGARISGVVTGRAGPIADVTLTLVSSAWRRVTSRSDAEGRFTFAGLPPDVYYLSASKDEYLETEFGASRPLVHGGMATGIALTAVGQHVTGLTIRLVRGGVISGKVRHADGRPAAETTINLAVRSRPGTAGYAQADSEGAYRIAGLLAGEYDVIAIPAIGAVRNSANRIVPVFYPGVTNPAHALSVQIDEDAAREDVDFALVEGSPTRITGAVVDNDGRPAVGARIGARSLSGSFSRSTTTDADGQFVLEQMVPGHYTLDAVLSAAPGGTTPDAKDRWATAEVDVSGDPLIGVTLKLQRYVRFSGRVEVAATARARIDDFTAVRIFFGRLGFHPAEIKVRPDGTFEHAARSGLYEIEAVGPSPGWRLRSAMASGRDLLDVPPELDPATGDLLDVVLTFTDKRTQLSGRVLDAEGTPVSECVVIAFPADRELWNVYSRRLTSARPATNGRYVLDDLAAGDYLFAVVPDLPRASWKTREFLQPLAAKAVRLRLEEGDRKSQDLRSTLR